MTSYDYDMVVIGSGPAGQHAAIQASKLAGRVAVIERLPDVGGIDLSAGTPAKTLREAAMHLTGYRERNVYGSSYVVNQNVSMSDLLVRTNYVMEHQAQMQRAQLARNRLEMITAEASFVDRHCLKLSGNTDEPDRTITAEKIVIAVGTFSTPPPVVPPDGRLILVSDDVLTLPDVPRTLTVVGAGAIGLEHASTFAALGTRVTIVGRGNRLLPFADDEVAESLTYQLRQHGVTLRQNETVFDIEYVIGESEPRVRVMLESGKQIVSHAVMYCVGRTGNTESLNLEAAGLEADERGRLGVDGNYETGVSGIYAVGGVIGFPDLVSTSQLQGRIAACHAFGVPVEDYSQLFPYAVYTIPEVAMVGKTESELTDEGVAYEVGKTSYRESVRSIVMGDVWDGFLKLLFEIESRKLLGVHIIGEGASEMIHLGQAVIAHGGTVDYLTESVIGHPTFAQCYAAAALDGIDRLGL